MALQWRNQFWQSLEEGAGKRCSECGERLAIAVDRIRFPCRETSHVCILTRGAYYTTVADRIRFLCREINKITHACIDDELMLNVLRCQLTY